MFDKLAKLSEAVTKSLEADIFFYSGDIDIDCDLAFSELIRQKKSKKNALLVLQTRGGSGDAAYRIAKSLQRYYQNGEFILYVNLKCKSAGTLIALGANKIIMPDSAELGPLDVQMAKPDEVGERISGLTPVQALSSLQDEAFKTFETIFLKLRQRSRFQITARLAANISARITTGLFKEIYAQVDPARMAEYTRGLQVAKQYGRRLMPDDPSIEFEEREETLRRLINEYPDHSFFINREEAHELFGCVRSPTSEEEHFVSQFDIVAQILKKKSGANAYYAYIPTTEKALSKELFGSPGEDKHEHHDNKGTKEGDQPKASEEQPPEEPDATKGESASGVKNQETGTNPDGGADASIKSATTFGLWRSLSRKSIIQTDPLPNKPPHTSRRAGRCY